MIVTDEMVRDAMNSVPNAAIFRREMRAALEAAMEARNSSAIDVVAKAREVIKPVSSAELIHNGHSDEWKLGFDVAAQAMAVEATRAVNVLALCIEELAAALQPFVKNVDAQSLVKSLGHICHEDLFQASITLARWGLEK